MDFPVEATVLLDAFGDETEVRRILRSHGFKATGVSRDQVRVRGSFLELKAAKARLERLLHSQTPSKTTPHSSSPYSSSLYSSSPGQTLASGAISGYYPNNSSASGGAWSRSGSRVQPVHAPPPSPSTSASWGSNASPNRPTSPGCRAPASPRAEQHPASRPGGESFVVDTDVLRFAQRLRSEDVGIILENHNVIMVAREFDGSSQVTLQGKHRELAAGKLQSLLNHLSKSLRTQEVPRKDMGHEGKALLLAIQKKNDIHNSVLVCDMNDRLRLIGPSGESYELKQKLLGRPVDPPGRTGRTPEKNPRRRGGSLPPVNRKKTERDGGAIAYPSPAGAAGYSPSKYQDDKRRGAEAERGAGARPGRGEAFRRRPL